MSRSSARDRRRWTALAGPGPRWTTHLGAGPRWVVLLGAGLLTLGLATGCGAGQVAATAEVQSAIDGANGNAGTVAVRNARILYPDGGVATKGGTATLAVSLVNSSVDPQQLVRVTTPAAASTALSIARPATTPSPSPVSTATASPSGSASASGSASPSASGSASPSPSASAASSPSPAMPSVNLTVPGQGIRTLLPGGESIRLIGLTHDLVSGRTVPVTFTFSSGASVTLIVPIVVPSTFQSDPSASATGELGEPNTR